MTGKVKKGKKVTAVTQKSDHVEVMVEDRTVYKAKTVVCCLPLGVLKANKIKFTPNLSNEVNNRFS